MLTCGDSDVRSAVEDAVGAIAKCVANLLLCLLMRVHSVDMITSKFHQATIPTWTGCGSLLSRKSGLAGPEQFWLQCLATLKFRRHCTL
jgi:hypothetical protein